MRSARTPFFTVVGFFLMLGLRSAVSEISGNTIFEHGGCFFLHAWSEISHVVVVTRKKGCRGTVGAKADLRSMSCWASSPMSRSTFSI